MSGGWGSLEHPYVENPYAGYIAEVHWGGAAAVKWRQGQILYIERAVAALTDTGRGVLSCWLKAPAEASSPFSSGITLCDSGVNDSAAGFSIASDNPAISQTWTNNFYGFGGPDFGNRRGVVYDAYNAMLDINKWYYVYVEWDTSGYTQATIVNGKTVVVETTTIGSGPAFTTAWKTGPSADALEFAPGNNHTHINFLWRFSGSTPGAPVYSIAEFWLELGAYGIGYDKFVDLATGLPKGLGEFGEVPFGPQPPLPPDPLTGVVPPTPPKKPTFYFSRRGEPKTFLINRGSAGDVHLSESIHGGMDYGDRPVVPPANGPVHEPDPPHLIVPASAMAA